MARRFHRIENLPPRCFRLGLGGGAGLNRCRWGACGLGKSRFSMEQQAHSVPACFANAFLSKASFWIACGLPEVGILDFELMGNGRRLDRKRELLCACR